MRKRERENPCAVCGHYHKYEEGEVCGVCGHRMPEGGEKTAVLASAFATEILPDFLYLGSYDNASRSELLKTQGISRILNTVPACQNLYKNSFVYHCLQDDLALAFEDANQFLEQCEKDRARVLVHCMSGKNRSPAVVIGYLMKSKGWRLGQSYQWVKERRPTTDLTQAIYQQLQEYEQKLFGSVENSGNVNALPSLPTPAPFSFGFTNPSADSAPAPAPAFGAPSGSSIFSSPFVPPSGFAFGAGQTQTNNNVQN